MDAGLRETIQRYLDPEADLERLYDLILGDFWRFTAVESLDQERIPQKEVKEAQRFILDEILQAVPLIGEMYGAEVLDEVLTELSVNDEDFGLTYRMSYIGFLNPRIDAATFLAWMTAQTNMVSIESDPYPFYLWMHYNPNGPMLLPLLDQLSYLDTSKHRVFAILFGQAGEAVSFKPLASCHGLSLVVAAMEAWPESPDESMRLCAKVWKENFGNRLCGKKRLPKMIEKFADERLGKKNIDVRVFTFIIKRLKEHLEYTSTRADGEEFSLNEERLRDIWTVQLALLAEAGMGLLQAYAFVWKQVNRMRALAGMAPERHALDRLI